MLGNGTHGRRACPHVFTALDFAPTALKHKLPRLGFFCVVHGCVSSASRSAEFLVDEGTCGRCSKPGNSASFFPGPPTNTAQPPNVLLTPGLLALRPYPLPVTSALPGPDVTGSRAVAASHPRGREWAEGFQPHDLPQTGTGGTYHFHLPLLCPNYLLLLPRLHTEGTSLGSQYQEKLCFTRVPSTTLLSFLFALSTRKPGAKAAARPAQGIVVASALDPFAFVPLLSTLLHYFRVQFVNHPEIVSRIRWVEMYEIINNESSRTNHFPLKINSFLESLWITKDLDALIYSNWKKIHTHTHTHTHTHARTIAYIFLTIPRRVTYYYYPHFTDQLARGYTIRRARIWTQAVWCHRPCL